MTCIERSYQLLLVAFLQIFLKTGPFFFFQNYIAKKIALFGLVFFCFFLLPPTHMTIYCILFWLPLAFEPVW